MAVGGSLTSRERVDRALEGAEVDRPPFTLWHHFRLQDFPGERHAAATLDFHRKFRTDVVKVMSDFPYPKPAGGIETLQFEANPFPQQLRALDIVREGLGSRAYFVETIFNPFNQARKTFTLAQIQRLREERPQALLDALEIIARSEASHARKALAAGAAGIFLAIDCALPSVLTEEQYAKFSEPFDRMVLRAVDGLPLNTLHLHGDKVYLDRFWKGWPTVAINYSTFTTGVPMSEARAKFSGVLMGGLDEVNYRALSQSDLKRQWTLAQQQVGRGFILTPGCSVPNESTDSELARLPDLLGA